MTSDRASQVEADERAPTRPTASSSASGGLGGLQHTAGNRAVSLLVRRLAVQRHAPGTALPDGEQLAASVGQSLAGAGRAPVPTQDPAAGESSPGGGAANPRASTEAELPSATGTATEVAAAGVSGTAYNAELTTAGASGKAMSLAAAQTILQGAFGDIHTMVPGSIQVLADRAACWAKYDEVCMAAHLTNPSTGVAWVAGDAERRTPGLDGFAWGSVVYVNGVTRLVTATAHEMLHNNTAAGFRTAVGEAINEGTTEMLAKKALTAAGVPIAAGRSAYPSQVAIVEALKAFVGEATLTNAYFSGAPTLVTAYETARGTTGSWPALKAACDSLNLAIVTPLLAAVPAPTPAAAPTPATTP